MQCRTLSLSLSLSSYTFTMQFLPVSLAWHLHMPIFATTDDLECRGTTLVSCICVLAVCTQKLLPTKIICCFLVAEIEGQSSCSFLKKKHTLKLALPTDPFKMTVNKRTWPDISQAWFLFPVMVHIWSWKYSLAITLMSGRNMILHLYAGYLIEDSDLVINDCVVIFSLLARNMDHDWWKSMK